MPAKASILEQILSAKRAEVAALKRSGRAPELRRLAEAAPAGRDFLAALRLCPGPAVIAEIKKTSPSRGRLGEGIEAADLARRYRAGGAAALSVLTDGPYFGGSLDDLVRARRAVDLPVLRKDFIIDPVQLHQAKTAGADAVLLIAAALEPELLADLHAESKALGLCPLVEVHAREELEPVLGLGPEVVGLNNRNLADLSVSLETSLRLRPLLPAGVLAVSESGISQPQDLARLRAGGLDAFLVGTALAGSADPTAALKRLIGAEG